MCHRELEYCVLSRQMGGEARFRDVPCAELSEAVRQASPAPNVVAELGQPAP